MSEFKFACPVCGQHITADPKAAGSQLECPTCFRKIVVPQPPSASDPKFILSAAEANKPRPSQPDAPLQFLTARTVPWPTSLRVAFVLLVILLCAAGTTLFVLRGKIFRNDRGEAPEVAYSPLGAGLALQTATNKLPWTLDLTEAAYPDTTASGRIRGQDFVCDRATLQGGSLTLRQMGSGASDLSLTISFYTKKPEALEGRTVDVTTNNTGAPRVLLRWKENQQSMTGAFLRDYALKLEFGEIGPDGLPGKIYICLPDLYRSCVAGTFNAEVRTSSAPKTRPPPSRPLPQ